MKFLIVGASGFLGHQILQHLHAAGHEVLGTCNTANRPDLVRFDLLEDRLADRVDAAFFLDGPVFDGPVFVIVCASICQIDLCYRERDRSRRVNVEGTMRLFREVRDLGGKGLFISSSYVFDGRDGGYTESSSLNPICEYGRHKAEVEEFLQRELPESLILRLDKLVAAHPAASNLFSQWMEKIDLREPILCIGDQVFAPTLIDDVARAVEDVCQRDLSGVFHAANSEHFLRDELAREFVEMAGSEVAVTTRPQESFPFDDARPLKTWLGNTKLQHAIGMPWASARDMMRRFLQHVH